jgi:hypothetical protein
MTAATHRSVGIVATTQGGPVSFADLAPWDIHLAHPLNGAHA